MNGASSLSKWILIGVLTVASIVSNLAGEAGFITNVYAQEHAEITGNRSPWTDWYRYPMAVALLKLARMRERLDQLNLFDSETSYPVREACTEQELGARTVDGSCNDPGLPMMGAAGIAFGRNVPLTAVGRPEDSEILNPNPREISRALLTRHDFQQVEFLNLLAVSWIQFMIHDWFSHGDNEADNPIAVPLAADDPWAQSQSSMLIPRTRTDSSGVLYKNEVTHWWDGSQLYGSDVATHAAIREGRDGLIKVNADGRLPLASDGVELTGFKRNWWVGLSLMHQLFASEHNSIARMLKGNHPTWSDQQIFDKARLINSALMAKIHTVEWTPGILNNKTLRTAMNANWYGLLNPTGETNPPFEVIDHDVLFGIVGGRRDLHGVPFTLTEEFVSVYRMHPLLPEELAVRQLADGQIKEVVKLTETRDQRSHEITDRIELKDLFYSFGVAHPGALTLNNYPRFLQGIDIPIVGKVDLATVDLVRDRERGVPRYNEFRRLTQLKPITKFEDLTTDARVVSELRRLYNNDIEMIDLLVGCLAESVRPTGYGFGETAFQIFILMASRRLQADRFYTEDFRPEVYTREGIEWVDRNSLKTVLLRHYPELRQAMNGVNNAFRPWNL